jgi:hypothetical protein
VNDHLSFNPYETPPAIIAPATTTDEELLILKSAQTLVGTGDLCVWVYPDAGELVVVRRPRNTSDPKINDLTFAGDEYVDYQLGRAMAATTRMRRYCKANGLRLFESLNYAFAKQPRSLDTASRDPERLFSKLRKTYGHFPYVAVAEFGEQFGQLHWHLLLPELIEPESVEKAWHLGRVWTERCPTTEDLETVIRYLSKDFADLRTSVHTTLSSGPGICTAKIRHIRTLN